MKIKNYKIQQGLYELYIDGQHMFNLKEPLTNQWGWFRIGTKERSMETFQRMSEAKSDAIAYAKKEIEQAEQVAKEAAKTEPVPPAIMKVINGE